MLAGFPSTGGTGLRAGFRGRIAMRLAGRGVFVRRMFPHGLVRGGPIDLIAYGRQSLPAAYAGLPAQRDDFSGHAPGKSI